MKLIIALLLISVVALNDGRRYRHGRYRRPRPTEAPDARVVQMWRDYKEKVADFWREHKSNRPTGRPSYADKKAWRSSYYENMKKMRDEMKQKYAALKKSQAEEEDETAIFSDRFRAGLAKVKQFWQDYRQKMMSHGKTMMDSRPTGRPSFMDRLQRMKTMFNHHRDTMKELWGKYKSQKTAEPQKDEDETAIFSDRFRAGLAKVKQFWQDYRQKMMSHSKTMMDSRPTGRPSFMDRLQMMKTMFGHHRNTVKELWGKYKSQKTAEPQEDEDETAIFGDRFRGGLAKVKQFWQDYRQKMMARGKAMMDSRPTGRPSFMDRLKMFRDNHKSALQKWWQKFSSQKADKGSE